MEEILSSIRRIIADEEQDDAKPGHDDLDLGAQGAEGDLAALDDDVADDDADDVLELTKVVREGGEVVDLKPEPLRPAPPFQIAEEVDEEEPLLIEDEPEGELELAPYEEEEDEPAPLPAAAPAAQFTYDADQEDEPAVSTKKAETDALLSTGTASATTGAFAKLSKAFRPTPVEESIADGSGRTIEQFIEDMARPMLKEWLDEHMPAIVERLVQKEIQKIARRAELL